MAVRDGDLVTVRRQIAEGQGAMPGFARRLTAEQLDGIARYTVALVASHGDAGAAGPAADQRSAAGQP